MPCHDLPLGPSVHTQVCEALAKKTGLRADLATPRSMGDKDFASFLVIGTNLFSREAAPFPVSGHSSLKL